MSQIKFDNVSSRIIRLVFIACVLHVLSANAQSNSDMATDTQNSIQALNVSKSSNGRLVLAITLKNPLKVIPNNFAASNPPRIAFDLTNTKNDLAKSVQEINQGDFRSINIAQAGNRTRLVFNLAQMLSYSTKIDGNNLLVTLDSISNTAKVSRFAEGMPNAQGHNLRDIDFHRGDSGEGRIEISLSDANTGIDIRQQGSKVIVDFINTNAPRNLQRKLDVTDFATPVDSIDTFAQGENVRMVIAPKGLWEQIAYQTDKKFVIEIKPKRPDEPGKKNGKTIYSGDKLTLNFQSIQVREALSVIADFTGLNIVISDSVNGNVTLRLKDVPWDQALDIILQSKGLDMRKNGNVVQVAPRDEIAAREKVTMTAAQDVADLEPLITESFRLSYQKGGDIITLITNKDQHILSKRGSAVVDQRTNTLFVQDTPSRLEDVRKLIQQVDVPVRQVMIEARFISATEKFSRTLGGRLGYASSNQAAPGAGFSVGAGQLGNSTGNVNLPGAGSGAGGVTFSLFNPANTKTLQLELAATEVDGTSKNIASPRIVTANNVSATITAGTQIPYVAQTSSGATAISFIDAALTLNVTPQITPDDHVNMKLAVNQNTVGTNFGTAGPSIEQKKITTEVLVDNGGTVVIGGVYTKDVSDSTTKVPLLGDIPIIGWLFKNNTVSDNKSELLVFITPKILKDTLNLE